MAVSIYPLSVLAQRATLIDYLDTKSYQDAELQIKQLLFFYYQEPVLLSFIGDYYQNITAYQKAIKYYLRALKYSPNEVTYLTFIYESYGKWRGEEKAKMYIQEYINRSSTLKTNPYSDDLAWFYEWCSNKNIKCREDN
jgi:tetratricopeptide (TPR) repeat protein